MSIGVSLVAQTVKNLPAMQETRVHSWVGKIPWWRELQHTAVFLPREFHRQRSLVGSSLWGRKESYMTKRLTHTHTYVNSISPLAQLVKNPPASVGDARDASSIPRLGRSPGEGNGSPRQYSCLENFMKRGAWRTIVHGVAKSRTWLTAHTHMSIAKGTLLSTLQWSTWGKNLKKEWIYVCIYIYMIHFGVQQKLTHYKSTILQ